MLTAVGAGMLGILPSPCTRSSTSRVFAGGEDTTAEMNPGEEAQSPRNGSTESKSTIAVPASWKAVLQASLASNRSIGTLSRCQLLLERFLIRGRCMCCWRLAPDVEGLGRFEAPVVGGERGGLADAPTFNPPCPSLTTLDHAYRDLGPRLMNAPRHTVMDRMGLSKNSDWKAERHLSRAAAGRGSAGGIGATRTTCVGQVSGIAYGGLHFRDQGYLECLGVCSTSSGKPAFWKLGENDRTWRTPDGQSPKNNDSLGNEKGGFDTSVVRMGLRRRHAV
jgi:hypothetical protein